MPPAAKTGMLWFRPMPSKYLQSFGTRSAGRRAFRSLVLKTQWTRMLEYRCAMGAMMRGCVGIVYDGRHMASLRDSDVWGYRFPALPCRAFTFRTFGTASRTTLAVRLSRPSNARKAPLARGFDIGTKRCPSINRIAEPNSNSIEQPQS